MDYCFKICNDDINNIIKFLLVYPPVKLWKKHVKIIGTQIYFTANGIKLGYLWDAGQIINSITLNQLLSELVKLELIPDTLKIVKLYTDIFIVNESKLDKLIHDNKIRSIPLIDVTNTLEKPQMLINFNEKLDKMIKFISDRKYNLDDQFVPPDICGPTVIGILIGYPVVYWYDTELSSENNLSHTPLKVFQLSHNDSTVYSFSVPNDLLNQNHILNQIVEQWLNDKSRYFKIKTFITDPAYVIL